jgi:hypothetical protein
VIGYFRVFGHPKAVRAVAFAADPLDLVYGLCTVTVLAFALLHGLFVLDFA